MYTPIKLRRREIYGITGNKGHGKDTFARLVLDARGSGSETTFQVHPFAGTLKRMAARIFGLTDEQMHDPAHKEVPLKVPLEFDLFVERMRQETGLDIQPAGRMAKSPREVMQFFGTEYVRRAQDDYWIQRLLRDTTTIRRVLVPDTRFQNEAKALRSVGGKIIKIIRIDLPAQDDGHASETELAGIEPDLLIGTVTGDLSLPRRLATLIAQGKFEAALKYDYRRAQVAIQAYVSGQSAEESARLLGQSHKDPYVLYNLLDYYGMPVRRQAKTKVPHRIIEGAPHKFCSPCQNWRALSDFNRASKAWDGLAGLCRVCASRANKEKYNKYDEPSLEAIYAFFKASAPFRNRSFDLTLEDLRELWDTQKGRCAYSGRQLTFTRNDPDKVSLDRVDSTLGYSLSNVRLCTVRVNLMKRSMTLGEFREIVSDLHSTLSKDT